MQLSPFSYLKVKKNTFEETEELISKIFILSRVSKRNAESTKLFGFFAISNSRKSCKHFFPLEFSEHPISEYDFERNE